MSERNNKGQFATGNRASPGRPPRNRERDYLNVTLAVVSLTDWQKVVKKALKLAIAGDFQARRWLSDYVLGKPPQILELKGLEAQQLAQLLEAMKTRGVSAGELFESMLAEIALESADLEGLADE